MNGFTPVEFGQPNNGDAVSQQLACALYCSTRMDDLDGFGQMRALGEHRSTFEPKNRFREKCSTFSLFFAKGRLN
jgi:hypothetical protein